MVDKSTKRGSWPTVNWLLCVNPISVVRSVRDTGCVKCTLALAAVLRTDLFPCDVHLLQQILLLLSLKRKRRSEQEVTE